MARVVVGIDGTPNAQRALVWAAEEAARRDAELVVVHAWHVPAAASGPGWPLYADATPFVEAAEAIARAAIAELDPRAVPRGVTSRVVHGDAATVLLEEARAADLVVVGSSRRSRFGELLFGSVSRQVARRTSVPIVVVPPDAEREAA